MLATIILCASSHQLDIVKEQLFTDWTTSSRIANVTIGLPTEEEVDSVARFIEQIRAEVISTSAGDLTSAQRELDVPFLMGMIDGITMEYAPSYASKCLAHLDKIDSELEGIAASREWRMRHRAAVILGDEEGAINARNRFWSLSHRHPEDVAIFKLYDIQLAFDDGDIEGGRRLYNLYAKRLTSRKSQFLRTPFAHAYARIAPTQSEAIHGWCTLADWLVEYGYDQNTVDDTLVQWISRLQDPFVIEENSEDPRIAALALRQEITKTLLENTSVALELLMELARAGDGRAAERVLEQGDSEYADEAVQLLFKFPDRVRASLDYWQLYASRLDIKNRNFKQAIARLTPISNGNGEHRVLAMALLDAIGNYEIRMLTEAFEIENEIPTSLRETYQPNVMQDLFQQCIYLCQTNGLTQWNTSAIGVLLTNSDGVAPSILAESYRLYGQYEKAIPLFEKAIKLDGPSVQTTTGLADCTGDIEAMQRVVHSTSPDDASSYWYWLSNVRLLQWFIAEGGDKSVATAKINRLRKKDASLGGAQFMSQFNEVAD